MVTTSGPVAHKLPVYFLKSQSTVVGQVYFSVVENEKKSVGFIRRSLEQGSGE